VDVLAILDEPRLRDGDPTLTVTLARALDVTTTVIELKQPNDP